MNYEPIIGLEVHVELNTNSKMFCGCPADYFGKNPNTHTCPVCLGLPGALPVPNKKAIEWTILLGAALGCKINKISKFDRKNYFYPDLAKGYQISQYDEPISVNGELKFKFLDSNNQEKEKIVRIRRVHLEEDTGKLIHSEVEGKSVTLVDFNRSGVPLVEIVTEPDMHSSEEAKAFLKEVQKIIRYLKISEADMEKGSMRLEPSISLRAEVNDSSQLPPYRVEVKNINSFRFAQKAIDYEITRQKELLDSGQKIPQETRGWNESKGVTTYQRSKEEAHDYRYFPEPDIPPLRFTDDYINGVIKEIPELPLAKVSRFTKAYDIKEKDAVILTEVRQKADFFELLVTEGNGNGLAAQTIANLIINGKVKLENKGAKDLISEMLSLKSVDASISEREIEVSCQDIISKNPSVANDFKSGKTQALEFLLGQSIRILKDKGRPDPKLVREILLRLLNNG